MTTESKMTVEYFKEVEPVLKWVEDFAKSENERAKTEFVTWADVWGNCKIMQDSFIGHYSKGDLNTSEHYDLWTSHLELNICKDCR
jgi:hypothetical protein